MVEFGQYPLVYQLLNGVPVGIAEASSIIVSSVSANTYQGLTGTISFTGVVQIGDATSVGASLVDNSNPNYPLIKPLTANTDGFVGFTPGGGTVEIGWAGSPLSVSRGGTNAFTETGARANLGLTIGTHVQAQNTNLQALADLTGGLVDKKILVGGTSNSLTSIDAPTTDNTFLKYTTAGGGAFSWAAGGSVSYPNFPGRIPYISDSTTLASQPWLNIETGTGRFNVCEVYGSVSIIVGNTDTTVTRSSAGNISVAGNLVYRANGTDIPVADGGTGKSSFFADQVIFGDDFSQDATFTFDKANKILKSPTLSSTVVCGVDLFENGTNIDQIYLTQTNANTNYLQKADAVAIYETTGYSRTNFALTGSLANYTLTSTFNTFKTNIANNQGVVFADGSYNLNTNASLKFDGTTLKSPAVCATTVCATTFNEAGTNLDAKYLTQSDATNNYVNKSTITNDSRIFLSSLQTVQTPYAAGNGGVYIYNPNVAKSQLAGIPDAGQIYVLQYNPDKLGIRWVAVPSFDFNPSPPELAAGAASSNFFSSIVTQQLSSVDHWNENSYIFYAEVNTLSATNISATNYYNLPNVSALNGTGVFEVTSYSRSNFVLTGTNLALSNTVSNHIASAVHWELSTLNNNYINASGDSANASFFLQDLSATNFSATNYSNLPSSTITWQNAYNAERVRKYVKNTTGSTIAKGRAVTVVSATGDNALIAPLSSVNTHVPEAVGFSNHVFGLTETQILNDDFGYIITEGLVVGTGGGVDALNTSLFSVGDILYVSSNGLLSNVRPPAPYEAHPVGYVIRSHANVGSIYVKIETVPEINDIVGFNLASSLINGDLITYDLTTSTFINTQSINLSGSIKGGSVSATNLSATNARITSLSATTVSATTYQNYPLTQAAGVLNGEIQYTNGSGAFDSNSEFYFSNRILYIYDNNSGGLSTESVSAATLTIDNATITSPTNKTLLITDYLIVPTLSATSYLNLPSVTSLNGTGVFEVTSYSRNNFVLTGTNLSLSNTVNNHISSAVHWDLATLNSNYINASGDSVTGPFFFGTLSATTFSATTYQNLPTAALSGLSDVLITSPATSSVLKWNGTKWVPATDQTGGGGGTPGGSQYNIQVNDGAAGFYGDSSLVYDYDANTMTIGVGDLAVDSPVTFNNVFLVAGTAKAATVSATTYLNLPSGVATWNANKLQGVTVTSTVPVATQHLEYDGTSWKPEWNSVSTINSTVTLTNTCDEKLFVSSSGSKVTVTLPDPTTCAGKEIQLIKSDPSGMPVYVSATTLQSPGNLIAMRIPRDMVQVISDGTNWYIQHNNSSYGGSHEVGTYDVEFEDFIWGSTETGEVGIRNWSFTNGTVTVVNNTGADGTGRGVINRQSGTTANQVASMYPSNAGTNTTNFANEVLDFKIRQYPTSIVAYKIRFGMFSDMTADPPASGIYFECSSGQSNYQAITRNGAVETKTDTGVAVDAAAFSTFRIFRRSDSAIEFYINDNAVATNTANIPSQHAITFGYQCIPTTTTAKGSNIDYLSVAIVDTTQRY